MSVIYQALRNKKRSESSVGAGGGISHVEDHALEAGEGGVVGVWFEYVRNQVESFRAWFVESSPQIRAMVVALPVLLVVLIGAGSYWYFMLSPASLPQPVDVAKKAASDLASGARSKAGIAKAEIEEALFSGVEPEKAGVSAVEESVDPVDESESVVEEDDLSEEKLRAIFGDSSPSAAEPAISAKQEPAPLVVTPEEEAVAIGKGSPVEEVIVPLDVQEAKERDVGRVVADLRLAMGRQDLKGVEKLFVKLAKVKSGGQADPFVLNMRAYWEISNGRYDKANELLKMILDRRKDDLEAGLNMAVVEMRTNRMSEARERLFVLLRLYPGDARPGEMLRFFR